MPRSPYRHKPMVRDPRLTRAGDYATINWSFGELCSHIRAQVLFNVMVGIDVVMIVLKGNIQIITGSHLYLVAIPHLEGLE